MFIVQIFVNLWIYYSSLIVLTQFQILIIVAQNKIMRLSFYRNSPERVNPQFIGVANKYSSYKKKRLNIESRKKQLHSDVIYNSTLNQNLEKEMQRKQLQLHKLRQARERHLDNLRKKQQLEARRQAQLQRLRQRNTFNRILTKAKINGARDDIFRKKKSLQQELTLDLSRLSQKYQQFRESTKNKNILKSTMVKNSKREGKRKIDEFYLSKNEESLRNYQQRIRKENSLRKEYCKTVKYHENTLKRLSETVSLKKNYIDKINDEISKYRPDIQSLIVAPRIYRKYTRTNTQSKVFTGENSLNFDQKQEQI